MLGNHLFGIYEKAFPSKMAWREHLFSAKELGFDFVEISIDETDNRLARLDMSADEKAELHRAIAESGIPLQTMCLSGHRRFPFGSADPSIRAKADNIMERAIYFAAEFGIRVIQLAGYDVYYEPSTKDSLNMFIDGLKKACRLAEQYQVMLAVEIMDTELLSSISRYFALKAHLPSPWLKVYPDIGNLSAWGNDTKEELRIGKDEIVSVHVKETCSVMKDGVGKFKCVPFGEGCVDFEACFRQLECQGYCGPYLIEMWYQEGSDWRADIKRAKNFVEQCFDAGVKRSK